MQLCNIHWHADMRQDVQRIFMACPRKKQVMMYSATMSDEMRTILHKFTTRVRTMSSFARSSKVLWKRLSNFRDDPVPGWYHGHAAWLMGAGIGLTVARVPSGWSSLALPMLPIHCDDDCVFVCLPAWLAHTCVRGLSSTLSRSQWRYFHCLL